ncbi:MAG TPA: quinone-dependent dihydroorotate dehydrogenase [Pyrinomonadaceae bacterium]|nr:quinone-dependent dihydroorotate dehydrogenase [Pyrinomonadaceae bacterium]
MLYRSLLRPVLFRLPPETAHEIALHTLSLGLRSEALRRAAASRFRRETFGELQRFGLKFGNPIGLAAGFDKNGVVAPEMAALGFGFVEVGTVTHHAQPGNPRPRLFRLSKDRALINRAGFNNDGASALARKLKARRPDCVLGINIGKSRVVEIEDAVADYLASFEVVHQLADYIAVNVSSPNTPHLRELQQADRLSSLLGALQQRNGELSAEQSRAPVPLLVKVSPDLEMRELEMIVDVARRAGTAGIIATNTTTDRAGLHSLPEIITKCGEGGLSGAPLRKSSTQMIASLHQLSGRALTIVGVGGIFNAADAWEKICAGASLVQLYTGLVYEGVGIARDINDGLAEIMHKEGFRTLDEAIGCRTAELAAA